MSQGTKKRELLVFFLNYNFRKLEEGSIFQYVLLFKHIFQGILHIYLWRISIHND